MRKIKGQSIYWQLNNFNWVHQKYEVEELTSYQMADIVGCSQWAIISALKRFNIMPRKWCVYKELQDEEWLHQKYDIEELSIEKIAKILSCGTGTVWDALNRVNITCRPHAVKGEKNPHYGMHRSKATREKQSKAKEGKYDGKNNPFYGKKHTKEAIEKWSGKRKGKHSSPETEFKKGLIPWNKGKHPEGRPHTEDAIQKIGDASRERWQDKEFLQRWINAVNVKPTKLEKLVDAILQKIQPNEWEYNGDFSCGVSIGGMIPDFVNINGKKVVIEAFGDYWHALKKDVKWKHTEFGRKAAYSQLGYICAVIWEKDLKCPNKEQFVLSVLKKEGII